MVEVRCGECGSIVEPPALNEDMLQAHCRICGAVTEFDDGPDPTTMDAALVEPPMPVGTTVAVNGRQLVIQQGWWPARTRIAVTPGRIELGHGPLPWPSARVIRSNAVRHLYAEATTRTDGRSFAIKVLLDDGSVVTVVRGFDEEAPARYLEGRIGHHLGLVDHLPEPYEG